MTSIKGVWYRKKTTMVHGAVPKMWRVNSIHMFYINIL